MFELLIYLIAGAVLFIAGFFAGVKNAGSSKVEKTIDILKALKSKD